MFAGVFVGLCSCRYALVYTGNSASHKINKLLPNMEYSLRVSATNESGRGSWSLPSTFATPPQPPATPTGKNGYYFICYVPWFTGGCCVQKDSK